MAFPRPWRRQGRFTFYAGARGSFAHRLMCEAFFPTRGKEPKGDRWQPNRDSTMAAPGPLLAWLEGGTSCCARLIASSRGRHEGIGVLRCSSAGGRAAPVGHPRCARVGGPVGRVTACRLAWRDRSETVRFSAAVHGRRSWSSLRRPPQEVAASLDHGGAHNPHAKRGDRRGAPPERAQPSPFPGGEGVTAAAVTDRGSPACSASRLACCEA